MLSTESTAGEPPRGARGHAATAVTELHYVDPSEKADEAAADALGDLRLLAPGAER